MHRNPAAPTWQINITLEGTYNMQSKNQTQAGSVHGRVPAETYSLAVEDATSDEELDRFILKTLMPIEEGESGRLDSASQVDSFVLPQLEAKEYESYSPTQGQIPVLVVEDHIATQKLERFILEEAGYKVSAVASGEEALEAVINFRPAIVLMDVGLTGMDGFTACQHLREASDVPIIMVTGRDCLDDQVRALEVGADDYLTKSFLTQELVGRVSVLLRLSNRGLVSPNALRGELDKLHEGNIRLVVEIAGSIRKAIQLVGNLRDNRDIHNVQVVSKLGYMDITIRLACPLPIKRILLHGGTISKIVGAPSEKPYDSVFNLLLV